jgi:hypothetical protein
MEPTGMWKYFNDAIKKQFLNKKQPFGCFFAAA